MHKVMKSNRTKINLKVGLKKREETMNHDLRFFKNQKLNESQEKVREGNREAKKFSRELKLKSII